jgi:phytoene dehydrogenase-like protein
VGGGARSSTDVLPGLLVDHCSAIHQIAAASPFLADMDLARHGLRWRAAPIDCVHPLDDGSAGVLHRSFEATAAAAGRDGARWRRLLGPVVEHFDDVAAELLRPILHPPAHPLTMARAGLPGLLPASVLAAWWRTPQVRALWGGVAAHALHPLDRPTTSGVGLVILAAGHAHGWVVAEGGSQRITDALVAELLAWGGRVETGVRVAHVRELPSTDVLLLDVAPSAAADLLAARLPARVVRAYRRYRHGPGAFKVDFAVEGGVPWVADAARKAGTVHLGGSFEEVAAAEQAVHRGQMPARPFVLVAQQYLADPSRSAGDVHPVWSYAHVPNGYDGDATSAIITQIERFAPGFRERIVGTAIRSTAEIASGNPNNVGGDIIGGASSPRQIVFRPRVALDPYATGVPGVWLCSASTPPGAGAHGMCGANAADSALRWLRRARHEPPGARRPTRS